jgi:hypothetical protein
MARLRLRLDSNGRPYAAVVTLSRRNLLSLLHKLDLPGSFRAITNTDVEIDGAFAPAFSFGIAAEDDGEHYAKRDDPPGPMHPQTEAFVRAGGGWTKNDG